MNGIFIFIISMFWLMVQRYEINLKAQCFRYRKMRKW
nr:MAG TPA: hypothetical protein [Caudoviricetes sp.]